MAYERRYDRQMPFVGTGKQHRLLTEEAKRRKVSIAFIIRELINARYGLTSKTEADEPGEDDGAEA